MNKICKLNRYRSDQLPLLPQTRFSVLSECNPTNKTKLNIKHEKLSLFIAILYVIDMFGVFPFITLPGLLVKLGLMGIPLIIFQIILEVYTSFLLGQCWLKAETLDKSIVRKERYPYAAIAYLAYGSYAKTLVTILLDLSIFVGGIPNVIIAANNFERLGNYILEEKLPLLFCYGVMAIGLIICPLSWLKSPKYMRGLAILSVCVIICIILLLWLCLFTVKPVDTPFKNINIGLPPLSKLLNGYCTLAFQFDIHAMLLTLQIDMKEQQQVYWAVFIGIFVTCSLAILGALISVYKLGINVTDNILQSLPESFQMYIILVLVSLQLCFSFVANSSALYLQIENYFDIPEVFTFKRVTIRTTVVIFQILISEFVPNFDALMDIMGGTITGPIIFILPPLFYKRICQIERQVYRESNYGSMSLNVNNAPIDYSNSAFQEFNIRRSLRNFRLRIIKVFNQMHCDLSLPMVVLLFGLMITFSATYLNIFQLSVLLKNNSPCISNFTIINF